MGPRRSLGEDIREHDGMLHGRWVRLGGAAGRTRAGSQTVVIKNQLQWYLEIDYLSVGIYFLQAACMLQHTNKCSGLASIGACSDLTISKYARISCVIDLQKMYELLEEAWIFTVALDMSTYMSMSYLYIRIHMYLNRHGIVNVHLLAVPV